MIYHQHDITKTDNVKTTLEMHYSLKNTTRMLFGYINRVAASLLTKQLYCINIKTKLLHLIVYNSILLRKNS